MKKQLEEKAFFIDNREMEIIVDALESVIDTANLVASDDPEVVRYLGEVEELYADLKAELKNYGT